MANQYRRKYQYTDADSLAAWYLVEEVGLAEAARRTGVPAGTLSARRTRLGRSGQVVIPKVPNRATQEWLEKVEKAVELVPTIGIKAASKETGIPGSTIRKNAQKQAVTSPFKSYGMFPSKGPYDRDFREAVIRYAKETNLSAASREYNVNRATVVRWVRDTKEATPPSRYDEEFKDEVVDHARKVGCTEAYKKYGVHWSTISRWIQQRQRPVEF